MVISFSDSEMEHVTFSHDDALVITAVIDGYDMGKVFIDSNNSTDVLFLDALKNMGKSEKE